MQFEKIFSPEVAAAAEVSVRVGGLIANGKWSSEMKLKPHPTFGTASVSKADVGSQKLALAELADRFPSATFIAEEEGNARPGQWNAPLLFSLDLIDGSTPNRRQLDRWCSAVGVMKNGAHHGGVVFAPEERGGLTIAGEQGNGVYLWEHGSTEPSRVSIGKLSSKPVVWFGLDVGRTDTYSRFNPSLPKELKVRGIADSGALGLAFVAAGRVDALVQSPQMPWDWIGGFPLILEARGAFQCFHIERGRVVPVTQPTEEDYRTDAQMLGFVAGHPDLVPKLFECLEANVG